MLKQGELNTAKRKEITPSILYVNNNYNNSNHESWKGYRT